MPSWLTFTLVATTFGCIGGGTTWLLNVYSIRKTRAEGDRVIRELERAERRLVTPEDPNWERLSKEAYKAFEQTQRTARLSSFVPVIVAAGLVAWLVLAETSQQRDSLSARLADASRQLSATNERAVTLQRQLETEASNQLQLRQQVRRFVADARRQVAVAAAEAHWSGSPLGVGTAQAERCRREIERISPILNELDRLSRASSPNSTPSDQ